MTQWVIKEQQEQPAIQTWTSMLALKTNLPARPDFAKFHGEDWKAKKKLLPKKKRTKKTFISFSAAEIEEKGV